MIRGAPAHAEKTGAITPPPAAGILMHSTVLDALLVEELAELA